MELLLKSKHHLYLFPIFIITFISLFLPLRVKAVGMNCKDPEVYINHGQITVVEDIYDFPVKDIIENSKDFSIIVLLKEDNNNVLTTTKNIQIINPDPIDPRDSGWVRITYTLDYSSSRIVADRAQKNDGHVDINLKRMPDDDDCANGPDLYLDQEEINAILNAGNYGDIPSNACPEGCKDNQVCSYTGTGDIKDASNWSCQVINMAAVDVHGSCGNEAIDTAIGCIPLDTNDFTIAIIRYAIGLAGFTALVIMLIATIIILTGGSNPEQVKKGKEIFTSAIMGLLFIIFSAVILKIINQDILGNPTQTPQSQPIDFNNNQSPYSDTIRNIKQENGGSL